MQAAAKPPVLVLAALKEELGPLRPLLAGLPVRLELTGVGQRRAAAAARRCVAGSSLVISTGCCGSLCAAVQPGHLIIPRRVLRFEGDQTQPAPDPDEPWFELARVAAAKLGLPFSDAPLATVRHALCDPESKQACHASCGAAGVDMETAVIAEVAAETGVPYLAMRVVLDGPDERLPDLTLSDDQGRLLPGKLLRLATQPRVALTLAGLALRLRSASDGLGRCLRTVIEANDALS